MHVLDFSRIARSETSARRYLVESCLKARAPACPACTERKIYAIERGKRRRCSRCGHTFHPFAGTRLGAVKISPKKWLWVVKLFELEMPAAMASEEIGISYPTAMKAFDLIRAAIGGSLPNGPRRSRGPVAGADEAVVCRESERCGAVQTYRAVRTELIRCIIGVNHGYVICADRSLASSFLMYRQRELRLADRGERHPYYRVYTERADGFWLYARERFAKYHGISEGKLSDYIGEMVFRFEHRGEQLFDLLVERLCRPVSNSRGGAPSSSRARGR